MVIFSVNEKDAVCVICGGTCLENETRMCVCVCQKFGKIYEPLPVFLIALHTYEYEGGKWG